MKYLDDLPNQKWMSLKKSFFKPPKIIYNLVFTFSLIFMLKVKHRKQRRLLKFRLLTPVFLILQAFLITYE